MRLDNEDLRYLDDKFGQLHKRITESEKSQTNELHRVTEDQNRKIADVKQAIEVHKTESDSRRSAVEATASEAARKAVAEHSDKSWLHNPSKSWRLAAAIVTVSGGIAALFIWLAKLIFITKP